jgi:hypothetical protein
VSVAPDSAKAITSFDLAGESATINEATGAITLTVPYGTDVTALAPTIVHTGASINPTTAQDFTVPVIYTVTAADNTTKVYTVTVTVAPSGAKAITSFTLAGELGAIDEAAGTIALTVAYGTDVSALTATIIHTGVSVGPGGAQDFTGPVIYTVTAADASTRVYTVTVSVAPNTSTAPTITTTTLAGGTVGVVYRQTLTAIGDATITWSMATGALPDGLTLSVNGLILGTPTESGTFNFTITAANGVSPNDAKALSIMILALSTDANTGGNGGNIGDSGIGENTGGTIGNTSGNAGGTGGTTDNTGGTANSGTETDISNPIVSEGNAPTISPITDSILPLSDGANEDNGVPWWSVAVAVVVIAALLSLVILRIRRKA